MAKRRRSRKCRRCGKEFTTLQGKDYHVENKVCIRDGTAVSTREDAPERMPDAPPAPESKPPFRPRFVMGGTMLWTRPK